MGLNVCPRCGHHGLKMTDVMDRETNHKTRAEKCPNCGWTNI